MSQAKKTRIRCPKCGAEHDFTIWQSINTKTDPIMKQKVHDLTAFLFTCPSCGESSHIDYSFLYHQQEDSFMIYYINSDKEENEFLSAIKNCKPEGVTLRVVRSRPHFLEKLQVLEAGLDDRYVEIAKVLVITHCMEQEQGRSIKDAYFFIQDAEYRISLEDTSGKVYSAGFDKSFYEEIKNAFCEEVPPLAEEKPVVDKGYALRLLSESQVNI